MSISGKEDLRILKTREAIHKTFEEMICEMDYEQISIKELTERARINRKTFYLHYNSLDDLLKELQNKMAENLLSVHMDWNAPVIWIKSHGNFFCVAKNWGKRENESPVAETINISAARSQMIS